MKPLTERKFIKDCMSLVREFTQKRKVCLKKKRRAAWKCGCRRYITISNICSRDKFITTGELVILVPPK